MQVSATPAVVTASSKQLGTLTYLGDRGQIVDERPVYAGNIAMNIHSSLDPIAFRGSLDDAIEAAQRLSGKSVYPHAIAVIKDSIMPRSYTLAGIWGGPGGTFPALIVDSYRLDGRMDGHGWATNVELDRHAFSGLKAVVGFQRVLR